jgi:peroxiredoxin
MYLLPWRPLCQIVLIAVFGTLFLNSCSDRPQGIKIGDPAPAFTARDLDGNVFSLPSYNGKPVIIRFWSTDCKYCRADTPGFNRYFERYKDHLGIVYINMEAELPDLIRFVSDLEIEFPVISDKKGKIAALYHVKLLPQTIILDPDHRIRAAMIGGVSGDELHDLLEPYLHALSPGLD